MAEHGGYRKPANPAPVSGMGKNSKRTDGGPAQALSAPTGQDYGARKQEISSERIAPLGAKAPLPKPAPVSPANAGSDQPIQMPQYQGGAFNAPSDRPNEPVTAGAASGAGPGPEALNLPGAQPVAAGTGAMAQMLQRMSATDTTGVLGQLLTSAQAFNV